MTAWIDQIIVHAPTIMPQAASFLWQSSLLIAAGLLLAQFLKKHDPRIRHALYCCILVLVAILPLIGYVASHSNAPLAELPLLPSAWYEVESVGTVTDSADENTASVPEATKSATQSAGMSVLSYVLLFYAAGVALFLMLITLGSMRIRRWKQSGTLLTEGAIVAIVENYRNMLTITRRPTVIEHKDVVVPCTTGILRPVIFVPLSYSDGLSHEQLSSVIGHECAHIKRHDVGTLTVAALLRGIMWIHPLVWMLMHQIALLSEQSADAMVLDSGTAPDAYAETLSDVVRKHVLQHQHVLSPVGFIDFRHSFIHRIRAILKHGANKRISRKGFSLIAGALLLTAFVVTAFPLSEQYAGAASKNKEKLVTLRLVVKDKATNEALSDVELVASQQLDKDKKGEGGGFVVDEMARATTDANGEVILKGLRKDLWFYLETDKDKEFTRIFSKPNISRDTRTSSVVLVTKKARNRTITLLMERSAIIRGTVVDPDGNPVAGATVDALHAWRDDTLGNSLTGDGRYKVETNESGHYSINLPGNQKYGIKLIAHDGAWKEWRDYANGYSEDFDLKAGEIVENVTLHLTRPGSIQGVVIDKQGNPVADAIVEVKYPERRYNRYYRPETKSDENGNFTLSHVSAGDMLVIVPRNSTTIYHPTKCEWPEHYFESVSLSEGETVTGVTVLGLPYEEVRKIERKNYKIKNKTWWAPYRSFKSLW